MKKISTNFVCSSCGATSPKWIGKCPTCNEWNTYSEEVVETLSSPLSTAKGGKPQKLDDVKDNEYTRISTGLDELDIVLGGGIVPSSLILIGGDPGIGKSTLLTEVAGNLSKNAKVLYASAEESCSQVKMRAKRLNISSNSFYLLNETDIDNIIDESVGMDYLIIDSIQTVYTKDFTSSSGSVGQVKECATRLQRFAKANKITVFIVGHVTKDGAIAGPKVLEHIMDTVLYFEGENTENYKLLRAVKNRFGSVSEVGVFEMRSDGIFGVKDYSGLFISENRGNSAGAIVVPSISGNRVVLVEIQSLATKTFLVMPRRMALGIDNNKLSVLLAVLEKRAGIPFYNQDVYINAMGGFKLNEPAIDLAMMLSLASSIKNLPIASGIMAFGEVGLSGEVRSCSYAEKRVAEAIKMGFEKILVPFNNYKNLERFKDKIKIVPIKYIKNALTEVF